ncbi:MAG: phosphate acyltransferase PlsX [Paracoccaceae bacterium]
MSPQDTDPTHRVTLSVDAMGGDAGPASVVEGVARFLGKGADAHVILHGPEDTLRPLIAKQRLGDRVTLRHAEGTVSMTDKPAQVMRHGRGTSMWSAIDAVRKGDAQVCVSCGNTGALMAVAMLRLRKAEGVNRPAIACLWPSRSPSGFNIMLDVGADVRADEDDLLTFALMGASYARNGQGVDRPRVGLLNVGTEDTKGRPELRVANEAIAAAAPLAQFDYVGFVEGNDIPSDRVDVIVTDGFTGNVALKTGEGTARTISDLLRESFQWSALSKLSALMARGALGRLKKRIDPRRVNGGVFLGLNGTVVKSHGSADSLGVRAALELAHRLARQDLSGRIASRVAALVRDIPEAPELPDEATPGRTE